MTLGQAIGGAAGAIGGFLIGGPTGAILGFQIGLGVGSIIDPPSSDEPAQTFQNQDLQFNTFARNLPVPVVYGVNRVAGNILWIGNTFTEIREREATEAGKGAPKPPAATEVWYHSDFIMGLSEGEITDVGRVWIDDDEITDREGLDWIRFDGTGDQVADSLVVQALGADAPAFRHTAYLRFTGELGQANRIPNINAEVSGIKLGELPTTEFTAEVGGTVLSNPSNTLQGSFLRPLVHTADAIYLAGAAITTASGPDATVLYRSLDKGATWVKIATISASVANLFTADLLLNPDNDDLLIGFGNLNTDGAFDGGFSRRIRSGNGWPTSAGTSPIYAHVAHTRATLPTVAREPVSGRLWACLMLIPGSTSTEPRRIYVQYSDDQGTTWLPAGAPILLASFGNSPFTDSSTAPRVLYHNNRIYVFYNESIANAAAPLRFLSHDIDDDPATWSLPATIDSLVAVRSWNVVENAAGTLYAFVYGATGIGKVYKHLAPATWTLIATDASAIGSSDTSRHGYCVLASGIWEVYPTANTLRARAWTGTEFVDDQQLGGALAENVGAASFHGAPSDQEVEYLFVGSPAAASDKLHFGQSDVELNRFNNPSKIVRDFLTNARYGLGIAQARIEDASFAEVEAFCDEDVTEADGTVAKRFELDTVLDNQRPILDHLRDMLATFRGFLTFSQGKVKLRIQKTEDTGAAQAFDMDSIVADSFQWRKQSYRDRPNVIRVEYINAAEDYRHDFVEAFDDWDIDQTGERRERTFRLLGIKRTTQAQRMAQYYLDQAIHIVHACTFRVGIGALESEVGDIIKVTHDVPGWSAKLFRIWSIEEAEDDELTLVCLEHNDAIYHDRSIATQASLAAEVNAYALPWHVGRLSAYKRRNENLVEAAFTRLQSADNFAGALMYRDRAAAGAFEQLAGTALALAPTAYLDTAVRSVTKPTTGSPAVGAFSDTFNRTNNDSLGADWEEVAQTAWEVYSSTLRRGDPGSGGATGDALARTVTGSHVGDGEVVGTLLDTLRIGSAAQVGLAARWRAGGPIGEFYYLDYESKTQSDAVLAVGLYRVTSGPVWTLLSRSVVGSGAYFTIAGSPTTFKLRLESFTVQGILGSSVHVSAVDSWIQGAGQGGFARRDGQGIDYPNRTMTLRPKAYWRLGEAAGVNTAADLTDNAWHARYIVGSPGAAGLLGGDADTAVTLDGTSAYVEGSSVFQVRSALTAVALINLQSKGTDQVIIGRRNTNPDSYLGFILRFLASSRNLNAFVTGAGAANVAISVTSLAYGATHWVGMTYDVASALVAVYVAGSRQGTASYSTLVESTGAVPPTIGRQFHVGAEFYAKGRIDEAAVFERALSPDEMRVLYETSLGSSKPTRGERWDDFTWGASGGGPPVNSAILVRGLVDGWAARLFDPSSVLLVGAVASEGTAILSLTTQPAVQPASGFLQVFADQSFASLARDGRFPSSGFADFRGGDVYDYKRLQEFLSATQTHVPIFHPLGGWANVGSARVRAEEMGYATFTDSRLEGVTRGANGSPATSHTNILSLGAFVVVTGPVGSQSLLDLTVAATDPLSNMPFFASQSAHAYFGAASKFARLGMFLERNAGSVVSLFYEYSTGDGTWASLVTSGLIGPTDQTSGLRRSGDILVEPPGDWAPTNRVASGGSTLGDGTSRYFLRALCATSLATPPRELEILLDGDLLATSRKGNAYLYEPTLQDSAQALRFKAIAVGVRGQMADGLKAPVTGVWSA